MKSFQTKQHAILIKKFHTLLSRAGIDNEGKLLILSEYGVESSKNLTVYELMEVCSKIELIASPQLQDLDKARKRLIAVLSRYLDLMHHENNIDIIKGIACRAASVGGFNDIPLDKLRSLYNAFSRRCKDLHTVDTNTILAISDKMNRNNNSNKNNYDN